MYKVHTYVCVHVFIIYLCMNTSVLAKFVAGLEPKSQKGLSPWNHSTLRLSVALLFGPPRCLTLLPEALDWDCTYPWAHSSLGWILSLLSAASDVYYIALYKHICIYAPCGSTARICDGALNTNANLCNCVRVYVQVSWCVLICNAVACRATLFPSSSFLFLFFPMCGFCGVDILWLDFSDLF